MPNIFEEDLLIDPPFDQLPRPRAKRPSAQAKQQMGSASNRQAWTSRSKSGQRSGIWQSQQPTQQSKAKTRKGHINSHQRNDRSLGGKGHGHIFDGLPSGRMELGIVTFVILFLLILSAWTISPYHWVNQIQVTGNRLVPTNTIIQASGIRSIDKVKSVMKQKAAITDSLQAASPIIADVVLDRDSFRQLTLVVTEHDIVARVIEDQQVLALLENGTTLDFSKTNWDQSSLIAALPAVDTKGQKGKLVDLAQALRQLDPQILGQIESITLSNDLTKPKAVSLVMKDGMLVKAQTPTLAEKLNRYDQMMAIVGQNRGTLNLEVGAYFTPTVENSESVKLDANIDN